VRAVNVAVWESRQTLELFDAAGDMTHTSVMPSWADRFDLRSHCKVPSMPLGDILEPEEIRKARLIKVDVEGAEWQVVSGMASMLSCCRRDLEITIEVTPSVLQAQGRSCQDLLSMMAPLGFKVYRIDNDYNPFGYLKQGLLTRPRRLHQAPVDQADLILSRVDAEYL